MIGVRWFALALLIGGWLGSMALVFAQDEAVLNNPSKTVGIVKDLITRLDPSYETFWNVGEGAFSQGASISLYNISSKDIPIASVRLGMGTGMVLYGGVGVDLPGLTRRFVPVMIQGIATTQPLDVFWNLAGKYGRVGLVGGYSWDDNTPAYGVTVGAALSF